MKPVFIRPAADADLDAIFAWIARDDPEAAERQITRLVEAAKRLAIFSERGRARPEPGDNVRSIVVGMYLILYHAGPHNVEIVRFIHGAREIPRIIDSE